jgi:hypothetical protein
MSFPPVESGAPRSSGGGGAGRSRSVKHLAVLASALVCAQKSSLPRGQRFSVFTMVGNELLPGHDFNLILDQLRQVAVAGITWSADDSTMRLSFLQLDAARDTVAAQISGSGNSTLSIRLLNELLEAIKGKVLRIETGKGPVVQTAPPRSGILLDLDAARRALSTGSDRATARMEGRKGTGKKRVHRFSTPA